MNCTEISKADTKVDVPQNVTFFCECNSVRIGQNIQNEVSLERSIIADVVAYQFINLN